jgi:hypothetical protein
VRLVRSTLALIGLLCAAQQAGAAQCLVGPIAAEGGLDLGSIQSLGNPDARGVRFIGADNGLLRLGSNLRLTWVEAPGGGMGNVVLVSDADARGIRFIVWNGGGGRLGPNGSLNPVEALRGIYVHSLNSIRDADASGNRVISAPWGLFRLGPLGQVVRVETGATIATADIQYISDADAQGARVIRARNGLFRLDAHGRISRVETQSDMGAVNIAVISPADARGERLIAADGIGLFRLGPAGPPAAVVVAGIQGIGDVALVSDADAAGGRFIRTSLSLLRLGPGDQLRRIPIPATINAPDIRSIGNADARGARLLVTTHGLFRLGADGRLRRIQTENGADTGRIRSADNADASGNHAVATDNGLFLLPVRPSLGARGRVVGAPEAGRATTLEWTLTGECARFAESRDFLIRTADGRPVTAEPVYNPDSRELIVRLPAELLPARRAIQLYALDGLDQPFEVGEPVPLEATYGLTQILKLAGILAAVLHTCFFLGLTIMARWRASAASMLLDPLARTIGLWWGFALAYSATLQRWILRRWFDQRKAAAMPKPVLALPLTNPATGEVIDSDLLVTRLGPSSRVWLQGRPGMGKTTILRSIEQRFFSDYDGLGQAVRHTGFIPLFIRLRTFASTSVGEGDMLWAARLAERAFGGQGFILDERGAASSNLRLISAIVDRSNFMLLLDGANEVPWGDQVGPAAASRDRPGLLVASQGDPPIGMLFEHWLLPEAITDAIRPLLCLFMGDEQGDALFKRVTASGLLGDIRSGYDVRLIQHLAEAGVGELPATRLALYEAMVDHAVARDPGMANDLAASAWLIWLSGVRQFERGGIDAGLADQLLRTDARIIREVGNKLEFIHDQIEGYLAARHILDSANPAGLIAATRDQWRLRIRSEQTDLWAFVCEMSDDELARKLYLWTLKEPDDRIELQKALGARVMFLQGTQ